jgi:hypothetical protein
MVMMMMVMMVAMTYNTHVQWMFPMCQMEDIYTHLIPRYPYKMDCNQSKDKYLPRVVVLREGRDRHRTCRSAPKFCLLHTRLVASFNEQLP